MTDDINDVSHTSTLAKFENAVRLDERASPVTATLLPCPFCGGAMEEVTDEDGQYFVHPGRMGLQRADCWLSDAWVSDELTGEGSIGEWNTRASQPATPTGGEWDKGEHEGCGIDSQRALERHSRLSAGSASAAAAPDEPMIECPVCEGAGFSGRGTGYDDVCGECGGHGHYPADAHILDVAQSALTPAVFEAMKLARNFMEGPLHAAMRERNYAKASEYQGYIDTIEAALQTSSIPSTPRRAPDSCPHCHDETDCANVDICVALTSPLREAGK